MKNKVSQIIFHPLSSAKKIGPFLRTKKYMSQVKKDRGNQLNEFERLKSSYTKYDPLLVHIGCGPRVLKNWVNIDLSYANTQKKAYYVPEKNFQNESTDNRDFYAMNMLETGLPFPNNSVDVIYHEDFIEHIDQKEQFIFLAETLRVMKPGAIHRVNTPDLIYSMKKHSDFKKGKGGVYVGEWDKWVHKSILTPATLKEMALLVGYSNVVFTGKDNSQSKFIPEAHRPDVRDDDAKNIFADLIK